MTNTRRNFIRSVGAASIAALSLNAAGMVFGQQSEINKLSLITSEGFSDQLNYLTSGHFQPIINTFFRVQTGINRSVQLQLAEVKELKREANQRRGYQGESFSLIFKGSEKRGLPQKTYKFQHDTLEEFSLFLAPVGLKENHYEAVINRINLSSAKL